MGICHSAIILCLSFFLFLDANAIEQCLLDRRYNEATFLMTHNSTSIRPETSPIKEVLYKIVNLVPTWLGREKLLEAIKLVTIIDPNLVADQERNLERQLADGVRAFKLPIHLQNTSDIYSNLYVCHTLSVRQVQSLIDEVDTVFKRFIPIAFIRKWLLKPLYEFKNNPCVLDSTHIGLYVVFEKINNWLDQHPEELCSIYFDVAIEDKLAAKKMLNAILEKSGLFTKLYHHNFGVTWPTIRELINNGKRLVLIADCEQWRDLGILSKNEIGFGSDYEYKTLDVLYKDTINPKIAWGVVAPFKLFIIDSYTTPLASGRVTDAEKANCAAHIISRVKNYEKLVGCPVTFVMVDFYNLPQEEALRAIALINQQHVQHA